MRTALLFALALGHCAWLHKEDRVCDPTRGNIHRFTGFKISKELLIKGIFPPKLLRQIIFTNCVDGRINFQKRIHISKNVNDMWDTPFCVLQKKSSRDIRTNLSPVIPELSNVSRTTRRKVLERVFRILDGQFYEYSGANYVSTLMTSSQIEESGESDEPGSLVCYKIARRKIFAKQNLSYYMPLTFVGGIFGFTAPLNSIGMSNVISMKKERYGSVFTTPIAPLVAEDTTSQWIELRLLRAFGPTLRQVIPLFSSAKPHHLRFAFADLAGATSKTWADEIDATENYQYSALDVSTITQSLAATADLMHKIVYPISLEFLLSAAQVGFEPDLPDDNAYHKSGLVKKLVDTLTPDDLVGFALIPGAPLGHGSLNSLALLKRIQTFWNTDRVT